MTNCVLMVSQNRFPGQDAGAIRDEGFAKLYIELGFKVYLVCRSDSREFQNIDGINYINLYKPESSMLRHAVDEVLYCYRLKKMIKNLRNDGLSIDLIHLYDAPKQAIKYLINFTAKNSITIIHDSVEWYSPSEFKNGINNRAYKLKNEINTKLIKKPVRVIAISNYLKNHFISRGLMAIRIPVIVDTQNGNTDIIRNDCINIVYAGSPAKKDCLKEIISAYNSVDSDVQDKLRLHIIGISEEQAISKGICSINDIAFTRNGLKFYGRLRHEEVLEKLKLMDFSILVRRADERYAKAGFPTKVVEAMTNSVAMICNYSSDLEEYLCDGKNAIIIRSSNLNDIEDALRRVAFLDKDYIISLRKCAKKTAMASFDYRRYLNELREFID